MPVIRHMEVPTQSFSARSIYRTIVGDGDGSTPICIGIQSCEPGYQSALHSHPYLETITILSGQGEAWSEEVAETVQLGPGVTLAFLPNVKHRFWVSGSRQLEILGVHASPRRIVNIHEGDDRIGPSRHAVMSSSGP